MLVLWPRVRVDPLLFLAITSAETTINRIVEMINKTLNFDVFFLLRIITLLLAEKSIAIKNPRRDARPVKEMHKTYLFTFKAFGL